MFSTATILESKPKNAAFDTNAQSYISAVQAAGRTLTGSEQTYINTLFVNGKGNGWYNKTFDAGLLMWGTSAPSRVTFKAVSTLSDVSSPTYSSAGVAFDGATNYITTDINPSTSLTVDDTYLSIYLGTAPEAGVRYDIGCSSAATNMFTLSARNSGSANIIMYRNNGATGSVSSANATAGFFAGSRTSNTLLTLYKNGASIGTPLTASNPNVTLTNLVMYIGALNSNGTPLNFVARTELFWSVGSGLSSTEALNMSNDVNSFMTSMGLNVF